MNTQRGVWYGSQGPQRKGRKRFGADDRSLVVLSTRLVSFSVRTAGTGAQRVGERSRARRLQQGLLAPRLCRESGGVTPTAQMTRAIGRKRAEVQGSAPIVERSGRLRTEFRAAGQHRRGPADIWPGTLAADEIPEGMETAFAVPRSHPSRGINGDQPRQQFSSGERTDEALAREHQACLRKHCTSMQAGMGSERSSLTRNLSRGGSDDRRQPAQAQNLNPSLAGLLVRSREANRSVVAPGRAG